VKSPYAILAIGVAGCLALAWIARQVQTQATVLRQQRPVAARPAFQVHLTAPATTRIERQGGVVRRCVAAHAVRGANGKQLAEWIARETQATAYGALQGIAVHVTLYGADGKPPHVYELPARPVAPPAPKPKPAPAPAAPSATQPATPR
jgi:hypothetical protein